MVLNLFFFLLSLVWPNFGKIIKANFGTVKKKNETIYRMPHPSIESEKGPFKSIQWSISQNHIDLNWIESKINWYQCRVKKNMFTKYVLFEATFWNEWCSINSAPIGWFLYVIFAKKTKINYYHQYIFCWQFFTHFSSFRST